MSDIERQSTLKRVLVQGAEVKPKEPELRADSLITEPKAETPMFSQTNLMEEICEANNLREALKRVRQNRGAPGIDGMTVDDLVPYLKENWQTIKAQLLMGEYQPQAVRRVDIPKPKGKGIRRLGIPSSLDRFIQQAILQVLQKEWDPRFSSKSFGFRPGKSAHQAVFQAQKYVQEGYAVVVDIDLEKFFDRVHHDRLMSKLNREIEDKRVLKLIRAYLKAGIMEEGLVKPNTEGVPQGGPLSPFLSNVVLDELDRELEKRGHRHTRYADDCNIYVKSMRSGERVMKSVKRYITEHMKLKVNEEKSAVDTPVKRQFLGFRIKGKVERARRGIAPASIKKFCAKIRQLTRRNWSISMENRIRVLSKYIIGWRAYYGFCETPTVLRDLDSWIRRRLRSANWKQWKVYRNRKLNLMKLGLSQDLAHITAWCARGPWRMSHMPGTRIAMSNSYFDRHGLPRLLAT